MTVLGKGSEKGDDKVDLIGKADVATIMPNRNRLLKLQKRRSILTLVLSFGFLFIFLCGIFLTVCYIKRIGPFTRHISDFCRVMPNGVYSYGKGLEQFEVDDHHSTIKVPRVIYKKHVYHPSTVLHDFQKQQSMILHKNMCFVKPMMGYQRLVHDWFENSRMLMQKRARGPSDFTEYGLRIVRPEIAPTDLRSEFGERADSFCGSRPAYRLIFAVRFKFPRPCSVACPPECGIKDRRFFRSKIIAGRLCRVCSCEPSKSTPAAEPRLGSSNRVDSNCKSIRCENKCGNRKLLGCVQCRCADVVGGDEGQRGTTEAATPSPVVIDALNQTESPLGKMEVDDDDDIDKRRRKREAGGRGRSGGKDCHVVAEIFEGYTPFDSEVRAPLNYIIDC